MINQSIRLKRRQLSRKAALLRDAVSISRPRFGWIHAIRTALGMSLSDFADRMGISKTAAQSIERGEVRGSATIRSLQSAADALDCDLLIALVPRASLEEQVRKQAEIVARRRLSQTNATMALEKQAISAEQYQEFLSDAIDDILQSTPRELWKS